MEEASSDFRAKLDTDLIEEILYTKYCVYEAMRLGTPAATTGWFYFIKPVKIGGVTLTPDVASMVNIHAV